MLTIVGGVFNTFGVCAEVIDSPVYDGYKNSAVSVGRGQEWKAQNAIFENNSSNRGGGISNGGYLYLYGDNVFKITADIGAAVRLKMAALLIY